jgi:predicted Co/Zn/Cd cation transporter (cation efflux family)
MDLMSGIPNGSIAVAIVWSLYQGSRGVAETRLNNRWRKDWAQWQKFVVLDVHDFIFRFVCTLANFVALFAAYRIAATIHELSQVSAGTATLLVLAFLIGVIGVGGQLHYIVLLGKPLGKWQ